MGPDDPKVAPRWAQSGPKMAQEGPKMAPRGPKRAPRLSREDFKLALLGFTIQYARGRRARPGWRAARRVDAALGPPPVKLGLLATVDWVGGAGTKVHGLEGRP